MCVWQNGKKKVYLYIYVGGFLFFLGFLVCAHEIISRFKSLFQITFLPRLMKNNNNTNFLKHAKSYSICNKLNEQR